MILPHHGGEMSIVVHRGVVVKFSFSTVSGLLEYDKGNITKQVRINGQKVRCYCVKMSIIRAVLNLVDEQANTDCVDPWRL